MNTKIIKSIILSFMIVGLLSIFVHGLTSNPEGPETLTRGLSENGFTNTPKMTLAEAGNITSLIILGRSQTQAWQGYYGNITGYLSLDDANNWTMYDWYLAEPQGEIIASRQSSIDWVNVNCLNYTSTWSVSDEENDSAVHILAQEEDGINETFNDTIAGYFTKGALFRDISLGTNTISRACWATNTYTNDVMGAYDFIEVILQDESGGDAIYLTVIEDNVNNSEGERPGFNNQSHDFQIMVPVDGHDGRDFSVNYYFCWMSRKDC